MVTTILSLLIRNQLRIAFVKIEIGKKNTLELRKYSVNKNDVTRLKKNSPIHLGTLNTYDFFFV